MEKAAITGYSIVKPSRARKDKNEDVFTNEQYQAIALNSLLKNIRMTKKELDSTRYALVLNRPMWPHALIWTSEVISNLGLSPKLTYASDHGGASALFSMIQAQIALNSGFVDHVIIIGSDSSMTPFNSPNSFRPDRTWRYELNYEMPLGMIGPLSEAALIMRKHMETYGTTAEQLGTVAVAQRKNACQNPKCTLQVVIDNLHKFIGRSVKQTFVKRDRCIIDNNIHLTVFTDNEIKEFRHIFFCCHVCFPEY